MRGANELVDDVAVVPTVDSCTCTCSAASYISKSVSLDIELYIHSSDLESIGGFLVWPITKLSLPS